MRDDTRGSAQVEYLIVLCLVVLGACVVTARVGVQLVVAFHHALALNGLPVP